MADLSNLLGDVYGDDSDRGRGRAEPSPSGDSPGESSPRDRTPDWAEESVLDAAFANWVPGPPPDAPAAEREVFGRRPSHPASAAPLPDEPSGARTAFDQDDPITAPRSFQPHLPWRRADDDILPDKSMSRRSLTGVSLRFRRR
jgi:hypothetical protein